MVQKRSKKRTGRKINKTVKKAIAQEVNSAIETKCVITDYDEEGIAQHAESTLLTPVTVYHGNRSDQRIGGKIKPTYLELFMYFRPRSLVNSGNANGDPADQYDSAFYSRVIIIRQKPGVSFTAHTPVPITTANNDLFLDSGNKGGSMNSNFKDLYRKINPRLGTVLYDKKFFIPMQYKMSNTREIKFKYAFPKTYHMTYNDDSAYPDQPIVIMIINRFADDDTHAVNKTIEYTGSAKFFYKDA